MSRTKDMKAFWHERGIAWIAAFLLTAFLTITILSTLAVQAMTSAGLHLGVATDSSVLDAQMSRIYGRIDILAEEYGFSADEVKKVITREEIERTNRDVAAWWTHLLTEGDTGTLPRWYSANLEKAVSATLDTGRTTEDPRTIAADLTEIVERTVFPLRETLVTTGMDLVNNRVDVPGTIRTVQKLPLLGLALSLAAAGLIALTMGREIRRSLKYFGTAAAGCGVSIIAAAIVVLYMQPRTMVAQASQGLAGEIGSLLWKVGLEAGIAVLVLLAGGFFCLVLYNRRRQNTEEDSGVETA